MPLEGDLVLGRERGALGDLFRRAPQLRRARRVRSLPSLSALATLVARTPPARERNYELKPEVVEACARAAHEVNRAYCLALGDASQVAWEDAPEWQRSS